MAYQNLVRRLKFLTSSFQRHGAAHVAEVLRQGRIRARYAAFPPPPVGREEFMRNFEWYRGEASFIDDFNRVASRVIPLTQAKRKEFFTSLLLSLESYDDILTGAELVSEGKFPALGICIDEPDGSYDWHRDYGSGKVWPPTPFNTIEDVSTDGSDIKYPWELSRMYWIAWLGKAYWITGNTAWTREFTRLVDSWRQENPFNQGLNWTMPMEVGIRGFWLMMGFGLFYGSRGIEDEWWLGYLRLAWDHGVYLMSNLEYFFNLTNHYISNCLGLLALGSFFGGSQVGRRWFVEGRQRLIEELGHQVTEDGVHYERSIGYHRLVLEIYLIAMVLAERGGAPFPASSRARIEKMAEFTRDYIPPSGNVPQFGDSDDGIVLRLSPLAEIYDHRDTLALAGALFDRDDFRAVAGGYSQAALLISGSEGFERLRQMERVKPLPSRLYAEGGFAILRSSRLHVVADVGEIGLHGNNDTLAFTIDGERGPFIIDPGTYCYTRDRALRNELRSSLAHNGPVIDETEIAEFDGLWRIRRDTTEVRVAEWTAGGETLLEASQHAYAGLASGGITVSRRWELAGDRLEVADRLEGSGRHTFSVRFTAPGDCRIRRIDRNRIEIERPTGERLSMECSLPLEISEGWHSTGYGLAAPATYITITGSFEPPSRIQYGFSLI